MGEKKYPISNIGMQCISDCFHANSKILHPHLFYYITLDKPFCLTNIFKTDDGRISAGAECDNPIAKTDTQIDMTIPIIELTDESFLKRYYGINSFDDVFIWISKHKKYPMQTKLRLLNSAWKAFHAEIDMLYDHTIDIYVDIIEKVWSEDLYDRIEKYIHVSKTGVVLKKSGGKGSKPDKIKYINSTFIEGQIIRKFLLKYIDKFDSGIENINDVNTHMKNEFIKYIENKILKTI